MRKRTLLFIILLTISKTLLSQSDSAEIVLIFRQPILKEIGFPEMNIRNTKINRYFAYDTLKIFIIPLIDTVVTSHGLIISTDIIYHKSKHRFLLKVPCDEFLTLRVIHIELMHKYIYLFMRKTKKNKEFYLKKIINLNDF